MRKTKEKKTKKEKMHLKSTKKTLKNYKKNLRSNWTLFLIKFNKIKYNRFIILYHIISYNLISILFNSILFNFIQLNVIIIKRKDDCYPRLYSTYIFIKLNQVILLTKTFFFELFWVDTAWPTIRLSKKNKKIEINTDCECKKLEELSIIWRNVSVGLREGRDKSDGEREGNIEIRLKASFSANWTLCISHQPWWINFTQAWPRHRPRSPLPFKKWVDFIF